MAERLIALSKEDGKSVILGHIRSPEAQYQRNFHRRESGLSTLLP
jgi:hypothetical protein